MKLTPASHHSNNSQLGLHKVSCTSSQNISIAEIMQKNETFFGEREKYVFKPGADAINISGLLV
jgi:hypothetical protein